MGYIARVAGQTARTGACMDAGRESAQLAWTALTVRVAWVLVRAGIRPSRRLLVDARDHVLLHRLEQPTPADWERAASRLVPEYLDRLRGRYVRRPPESPLPEVDASWREAVEAACDPLALLVFRAHYGDGAPLGSLARRFGLEPVSLRAAAEGLRELAREEVRRRLGDELPRGEWVDALLSRIAEAAGEDCPHPARLLAGEGGEVREHARSCPRCARLLRLARLRVLDAGLLQLPDPFPPPAPQLRLLALHLHPQARQQQAGLLHALGPGARAVGRDSILVDLSRSPDWERSLAARARMGLPPRDWLRGAIVEGPSRWSGPALLGPTPLAALEASRARPWGEVDGVERLPDPLPPPPSVLRLWLGALLLAATALLVVLWVRGATGERPTYPIEAQVDYGGGAVTLRFDVDDRAYLDAFALTPRGAEPVIESESPADKAPLATGDGDYSLVTLGRGLLLVSSPSKPPPLREVVEDYARGRIDREALLERLASLVPRGDVELFERPGD